MKILRLKPVLLDPEGLKSWPNKTGTNFMIFFQFDREPVQIQWTLIIFDAILEISFVCHILSIPARLDKFVQKK